MEIFDVHTHMQDSRYTEGYGPVIERAAKNSVTRIMCCGLYESDWEKVLKISDEYEGVYPAFGIHPWFCDTRTNRWLDYLEEMILKGGASIGEIGLDGMVAKRPFEKEEQERVFTEQLLLAKKLDKPVNIHCRKAWGKLLEIIDKVGLPDKGGLVHSYSGSHEMVKNLEKRGLFISFSGSVTKVANKKARKALLQVSDENILVETDSPDINPEGVTGLNEPKFTLNNLSVIAELRGRDLKEMAEITFKNSIKLFG